MAEFVFCASCQRYRALPGGPKTPAGKPVCTSCHDKFKASQTPQHKHSVKNASHMLKKKPDTYVEGILKTCRTYD